jgi:urease accessory protein
MSLMPDLNSLLGALQHADSFFPSGSVAFSSGLEALHADREVTSAEQLASLVEGQLLHRWASFDAVALVAAFRTRERLEEVSGIDRLVEAMSLAAELREGSKRAGASLLAVHVRLGTAGATGYRDLIARKQACGHLPVVQGMLWGATGMTEDACRAVSAHTFCTGLVSAALRLGMIGHLDAQRVLLRVRPLLAGLLRSPPGAVECMSAYCPAVEIAAMRHEVQDSRFFAN